MAGLMNYLIPQARDKTSDFLWQWLDPEGYNKMLIEAQKRKDPQWKSYSDSQAYDPKLMMMSKNPGFSSQMLKGQIDSYNNMNAGHYSPQELQDIINEMRKQTLVKPML